MILKLLCAALFAIAMPMSSAYHGNVESTAFPAGIGSTGAWTPASMAWSVTQNVDGFWNYDYTLTVHKHDVSHIIIETSESFMESDLLNPEGAFTSLSIGWHYPGPGNPSMPDSIYGIKFDGTRGTSFHLSFDSWRTPVWGDFYAKDGKAQGVTNTVWNAGFTSADVDPSAPAAEGSFDYHILVPNTTAVPEPSSIIGLGTPLLALLLRRIKRKDI